MFLACVPFGFGVVASLVVLQRWLDVRTIVLLGYASMVAEFGAFVLLGLAQKASSLCSTWCVTITTDVTWPQTIGVRMCVDGLSCFFIGILLVALPICLVFLFSYFEYDHNAPSICVLSLLFSQLALVFFCSCDLLSMLILWEWISVVSFFLVQYWSMRVASVRAGLKVFVISQVGDVFFILGVVFLMAFTGATDIWLIEYLYTLMPSVG
jgi:formate hydrogenlyase subunit 3/multisubunit Na+/H+ antiporter MnhD subunit